VNIADIVRRQAASRGDDPAFTSGSTTVTWAEIDDRSSRMAGALAGLGVTPGDRVAMVAGNDLRHWELQFACAKGGFVVVPVNDRFGPAELAHVAADCTPACWVTDAVRRPGLPADLAASLIGIGDEHGCPSDYEELVASTPPAATVTVDDRDVAVIGYTSGTTGRAKGAMLSHHNRTMSAACYAVAMQIQPDERFLACLPAYVYRAGTGGMMTPFVGGHMVITEFEPGRVLDLLEEHRITSVVVAPVMLGRLLDHPTFPQRDLAALRTLWTGAGPIERSRLRRAMDALGHTRIGSTYGMTESAGIALTVYDRSWPDDVLDRRLASVGRPLTTLDLRLVDDGGDVVPTGEVGEIQLRGDSITTGYWRDPERTAAAFRDGWFLTGDLGYQDRDGYLYLVDRRVDVINTGGLNVYSAEVERVLGGHPAVAECAVIGVPDAEWGEAVAAFVVRAPQVDVDADELLAWCRQGMAGYKKPSRFEFVPDLPRNAMGKTDKAALRAPYWAGRDRSIGG
jgi:long-chain acyl-CoA synthetase